MAPGAPAVSLPNLPGFSVRKPVSLVLPELCHLASVKTRAQMPQSLREIICQVSRGSSIDLGGGMASQLTSLAM